MTSITARYRKEIASLRTEREMRLLSDDFAMTNGTIREIDRQIIHLKALLVEASCHEEAA
jgi:hypothetical protein